MKSGIHQAAFSSKDNFDVHIITPILLRTVPAIFIPNEILKELQLERNDRPVIIDIDADYFSNNGFDTAPTKW